MLPSAYRVAMVPSSAVRTVWPTVPASSPSERSRSRSTKMPSCDVPSCICSSRFASPGTPRTRSSTSRPMRSSSISSSPETDSEMSAPALFVRRPRMRGGRTNTRAPAKPRSSTRRCISRTQASAVMPSRLPAGTSRTSRLPFPPPPPPNPPLPAVAKTFTTCGISPHHLLQLQRRAVGDVRRRARGEPEADAHGAVVHLRQERRAETRDAEPRQAAQRQRSAQHPRAMAHRRGCDAAVARTQHIEEALERQQRTPVVDAALEPHLAELRGQHRERASAPAAATRGSRTRS